MSEIKLTIDGKKVKGRKGNTVLDVCLANCINIPTLCHLKGLTPIGACRLCAVEIEGEKKLNTACTYPARDGLAVTTNSKGLYNYRRKILEFLFAEKNHYCMFCEKSDDCELQKLAYEFQLYNIPLTMLNPKLSMDPSHEYLILDHNRCVACGRCIRACDEIVGLHVLDFSERGANTLVTPGLKDALDKSSCIGCGLCMQVCPTGAIYDKHSSYKFNRKDCEKIKTICQECSVLCPIEVYVKDGKAVRIESANLEDPRTQLCKAGRFDLIYNEHHRILKPMVRVNRELKECSMEEVLELVANKIKSFKGSSEIACIISSKYNNETLEFFQKFANEILGTKNVDTLDGYYYRTISNMREYLMGRSELTINDIENADCILLFGFNSKTQNPIHSKIRKAVRFNNAKLLVIDSVENPLGYIADVWLKPKLASEHILLAILQILQGNKVSAHDIAGECDEKYEKVKKLIEIAKKAKNCILIFGEEFVRIGGSEALEAISRIIHKSHETNYKFGVISIKPSSNSLGSWLKRIPSTSEFSDKIKMAYLLLGDDDCLNSDLTSKLRKVDFLVIYGTYYSPITSLAHVLIPATTWLERSGSLVSSDGKEQLVNKVLEKPTDIEDEIHVMTRISRMLNKEIDTLQLKAIELMTKEASVNLQSTLKHYQDKIG